MKATSPKTFRGALVFVVLLALIFVLPDIIRTWSADSELEISQSDPYQKERKLLEQEGTPTYVPNRKKSKYRVPPIKFDPNKYVLQDWMNLGLSEKQSLVILKFTKFGVSSNEDLKRIFVIDEELFQLIKDSTFYTEQLAGNSNPVFEKQMENFVVIELNSANEEELDKIPGVGSYFAKIIVSRRKKLGGYYAIDQLLELNKITPEMVAQWRPHFMLNLKEVKKIDINTASVDELKSHPYITWNIANSLVKLREQHGAYKKIEDIKRSALVNADLYNKLKYYLKVNE